MRAPHGPLPQERAMKYQTKKRFGQHFLTDQSILANLIGEMRPRADDTLVEIGPGLGALTFWLLKAVNHLQVIEIDRDLAEKLRTGSWKDKLTVHEVDVLKFDFRQLAAPFRVVGNLPYNISSPILFALLEVADRVVDQHFMLQKEVIDRMVAAPKTSDYGRLSVMLQADYHMDHLFDVPPESFEWCQNRRKNALQFQLKCLAGWSARPSHSVAKCCATPGPTWCRNTWRKKRVLHLLHAQKKLHLSNLCRWHKCWQRPWNTRRSVANKLS